MQNYLVTYKQNDQVLSTIVTANSHRQAVSTFEMYHSNTIIIDIKLCTE